MDAIATYGMSKGWHLKRYIVLVEGTSDEALFVLADELSRAAGVELFGQQISIVAAGEQDCGGTYGVGRELITLRSMAPYILDRDGNPYYRTIGLLDDDHAGRRIIEDISKIDRSALEFRDIVRLRPNMPRLVGACPGEWKRASEYANSQFRELDWEIEDTLSERLVTAFSMQFGYAIRDKMSKGGRTHFELTRGGKREFHRLIHREATLNDLSGVVDVVRLLRALFGMPDI